MDAWLPPAPFASHEPTSLRSHSLEGCFRQNGRVKRTETETGASLISFGEAAELFGSGGNYLEIFDEAHSDDENRFIAIGPIASGLVLVVWTERDEDTIRIISARWATPHEKHLYRSYLGKKP